MAEDTEETKEQEKPRAPKKRVPVKKAKTLKPKTEDAEKDKPEAEKPKPRPPAKKKKVVKKEVPEAPPKKKVEVEEKKAPKKKTPPKKKEEVEEEEKVEEEEVEEEEEEIEIVEEIETYKVKIKPELSAEIQRKLKVRKGIKKKTPEFRRQEWFRYKKLGTAWRRPRGIQSKARKHKGYRVNVVSIGYGAPAEARNLHPSGFKEIMVYNPADLDKIDPKVQAARIGHSVGTRKRVAIETKAEELGIRVLNPRR
jgi:large subunit ribosomal protein L32e